MDDALPLRRLAGSCGAAFSGRGPAFLRVQPAGSRLRGRIPAPIAGTGGNAGAGHRPRFEQLFARYTKFPGNFLKINGLTLEYQTVRASEIGQCDQGP